MTIEQAQMEANRLSADLAAFKTILLLQDHLSELETQVDELRTAMRFRDTVLLVGCLAAALWLVVTA